MGTWTETEADRGWGDIGITARITGSDRLVSVRIKENDGSDGVDITAGSALAEIVAEALIATSAFSSVTTSRSYNPDYANYTP
jgi:hypothetical protein